VRTSTLHDMESLNMDRAAPILIRIYKEKRTLEVWKQDQTGKFALLKSFSICKYSGKLGPKIAKVITKRLRDFMKSLQTR
jgi:murein L,D-transpeptidase YafK